MNNGELYKQAFGALHAPDTVLLTAEKGAERKTFRPARRLVLVCACTVLALGLDVTLTKTAKATTRFVSTRKI